LGAVEESLSNFQEAFAAYKRYFMFYLFYRFHL